MSDARIKKFRLGWFVLACLAGGVVQCPAFAADAIDPFQVESGHWMSFERYNDNVKRKRPVGNETLSAPPAPLKVELPEIPVPASPPPAEGAPDVVNIPPEPSVATPTRPINLPILPGVNKGFGIQVDSTTDQDHSTTGAQVVDKPSGESDLHLQTQNWQHAAEVARQNAAEKNGASKDNGRVPLDVRLTFLPNPKIAPAPEPERKHRPRAAKVPAAPKPAPEAPKAAECAAIDLYKKKQLEAIQSDRQTLEALQSAISNLGLQKQLNFAVGAQGSIVDATSQNQTPIPTPAPASH